MNIATMTPEQLAEHGIPVIVALRARLEVREFWARDAEEENRCQGAWSTGRSYGEIAAYRDALAILEAQGER
jgi:hypothetical protein